MNFTELNLNENLMKGIEDAGFVECTTVQERTLAETLEGRDVAVQSQTGTGKTAAFLITINQLFSGNGSSPTHRKALIIVPTRELAVQIEKEAKLLGRHLGFTIGSIYGGVGYAKQEALLEKDADIIIGTPGRLLDFNQSKKLDFSSRGILVIDEADRLFDMGFLPDLRRMLRQMPPANERMTMLFSATLNVQARELAWEHMHDPVEIITTPDKVVVEEVSQELYHVAYEEKVNLLLGLMNREQPANALIFTNTKHAAYEISQRLEHNGYTCRYLMGDLPQRKRQTIIDGLKSGKIKYLVATDVAARGLHVDDLELVINYDIPQDAENYVHRIGRTARAGKSGKAIALACDRYVYGLEAIEELIDMKIPVIWPDETLFLHDASEGKRFSLDKKERRSGTDRATSRQSSRKKDASPRHKKATNKKRDVGALQTKTKQQHGKTNTEEKSPKRSDRKRTRDERLEYYSKKYGETFTRKPESEPILEAERIVLPEAAHIPMPMHREKSSLLHKIRSFLSI